MNDELPSRHPNDPPIQGPHRIVHPDGTTQHVFGGPNTMPRPRKPHLLQRIVLRALDWLLVPVSVAAGALLAMAWGSLDDKARLAVAMLALVAIAGHLTIRRARRRRAQKT